MEKTGDDSFFEVLLKILGVGGSSLRRKEWESTMYLLMVTYNLSVVSKCHCDLSFSFFNCKSVCHAEALEPLQMTLSGNESGGAEKEQHVNIPWGLAAFILQLHFRLVDKCLEEMF